MYRGEKRQSGETEGGEEKESLRRTRYGWGTGNARIRGERGKDRGRSKKRKNCGRVGEREGLIRQEWRWRRKSSGEEEATDE